MAIPTQEPLGEGTSYTLWSSQRSLKRDHRRKFNRSLCGVLLGISIVLVIMGILGIIGIAVYLGGESTTILEVRGITCVEKPQPFAGKSQAAASEHGQQPRRSLFDCHFPLSLLMMIRSKIPAVRPPALGDYSGGNDPKICSLGAVCGGV